MDNLTHTLLGVGLANAGLKNRFGKGTLLFMAVASNLPDLDVFWAKFMGGPSFLHRRMLTHSVLGIPLLALAAAFLFHLKYKHISVRHFFGMGLLAIGVHVFYDLANSYGVVLLYPFSKMRFELAWVFIIDLVLMQNFQKVIHGRLDCFASLAMTGTSPSQQAPFFLQWAIRYYKELLCPKISCIR